MTFQPDGEPRSGGSSNSDDEVDSASLPISNWGFGSSRRGSNMSTMTTRITRASTASERGRRDEDLWTENQELHDRIFDLEKRLADMEEDAEGQGMMPTMTRMRTEQWERCRGLCSEKTRLKWRVAIQTVMMNNLRLKCQVKQMRVAAEHIRLQELCSESGRLLEFERRAKEDLLVRTNDERKSLLEEKAKLQRENKSLKEKAEDFDEQMRTVMTRAHSGSQNGFHEKTDVADDSVTTRRTSIGVCSIKSEFVSERERDEEELQKLRQRIKELEGMVSSVQLCERERQEYEAQSWWGRFVCCSSHGRAGHVSGSTAGHARHSVVPFRLAGASES